MKTIIQSVEVAYNHTTIQDAIVLLPLMNYLRRQAELEATEIAYKQLPKDEKDKYKWVPAPEIPNAAMYYEKLREFGFCSSIEDPIKPNLESYRRKE